MCKSKAEGGRRCHGHVKQRIEAALNAIDSSEPGTAARRRAEERFRQAKAQLLLTRHGIEGYIHDQVTSDDPAAAEEIAEHINDYLATARDPAKGSQLNLEGGRFTVLKATAIGNHVVLDVADNPQTCRAMSEGMQACYDGSAVGKQVTVVDPGDLRTGFQSRFVILDGLGGGGVKNDGEIAAIAALYSISARDGVGKTLVDHGLERGGTHLECFDTYLPRVYARSGFRTVASIPFNRDYAPDGWDYDYMARFADRGEPSIKFMASAAHYGKIGKPEERLFAEWDAANSYVKTGKVER